jgi:SAM-dependent methyltransferase
LYDTVLASIHDRWFSSFAYAAAAHLHRALGGRSINRILDLGCGSGVLLEASKGFAKEGIGIDISPQMIAIAKRRLPQARLTIDDVLKADIPPTDIVVLAGEILSYATAYSSFSQNDLLTFLSRVHQALGPDGLLLFDILGTDYDYAGTNFHDEEEFTVVAETRQEADRIERRIISFLKQGDAYKKSLEVHGLRAFVSSSVETALQEAGFSWKRITGYADLPLLPGRLGYECRRA